METEEHFYTDDPAVGHPDVRTDLEGVEYFFLGNGHIQAAVQVCTSGMGTPAGLLCMHPERHRPKRHALTMHPEEGLLPTALRIRTPAGTAQPTTDELEARWVDLAGVPAVEVTWGGEGVSVEEVFYCPDREEPRLVREIQLQGLASLDEVTVSTQPAGDELERTLSLSAAVPTRLRIEYRLDGDAVRADWLDERPDTAAAECYWQALNRFSSSSELHDHLFGVCRTLLPAIPAHAGGMDASIWQYNREWLRDQTAVVHARLMLGEFEAARRSIARLITDFVSEEGGTVDSGVQREPAETELDQNGELLMLVKAYVDWTGDLSLPREHWERLRAVAEYPLREIFRHEPSGLLHNQREYWERHVVHGVGQGLELAHQLYVSLGLSHAAQLAGLLGAAQEEQRWRMEAERLRRAMLQDERFSMIDEGRFIKRRALSGEVMRTIEPDPESDLPRGIPLFQAGAHELEPDTQTLYPLTLEFVDPQSDLARNTLDAIELLWNQGWEQGGYGRYNATSEAGAAAPWPITTTIVAQAALEAGLDERVRRALEWVGSVPGAKSGSWLEFYGSWPAPPYPQVGVIPWTWAEIVRFFVHHLCGVRPSHVGLRVRPRLLSDQERTQCSIRIREHTLRLTVRRTARGEEPGFVVAGERHAYSEVGVELPVPTGDLDVEAILPG